MRRPGKIVGLYAPQFEQFAIELAGEGPIFTGKVATEDAEGSAWVMPLGSSCPVMEQMVPRHDMSLMERAPEPYACVTQVSSAAVDCMPEANLPATSGHTRPWPASAVCTFVQSSCEEQFSPLKAGQLYYSRCIAFLPEYFEKLEERWPGSFEGLFGAFARPWAEDAQMAIGGALRRLSATRAAGTPASSMQRASWRRWWQTWRRRRQQESLPPSGPAGRRAAALRRRPRPRWSAPLTRGGALAWTSWRQGST